MKQQAHPDRTLFIGANLPLVPVPSLPEIRLHIANQASGLGRLGEPGTDRAEPPAPYWAFPWAGGLALARYILDRPETVAGRRVLDLGAGSGLVAIAAALAGAHTVIAADVDPYALAAIGLNAAANGVGVLVLADDLLAGPPPSVDLVMAGDVFYEPNLAGQMIIFLNHCLAVGIEVLVGDPRRAYLPYARLRLLAEYSVADVGEVRNGAMKASAVFAFEPGDA